jgi:hypothetical protein
VRGVVLLSLQVLLLLPLENSRVLVAHLPVDCTISDEVPAGRNWDWNLRSLWSELTGRDSDGPSPESGSLGGHRGTKTEREHGVELNVVSLMWLVEMQSL